jgi:menaquinone-9 beta-reductase
MDDVIVVGGGPAGAIAALVLARAGARVRIFERARFPRAKLCGDTLNPGAMRVLAQHLPTDPIVQRSLALEGMVLTGPGGARVRGRYGEGQVGRAIGRRVLDAWLLDAAVAAGAQLEEGARATAPIFDLGRVAGAVVRAKEGPPRAHRARVVIAADGRESRMARGVGLLRQARRPRRWAIGAYLDEVEGLTNVGEMHVRSAHYIGVAPTPEGFANACLVAPYVRADRRWRSPATALLDAVRGDATLGPRFARARLVEPPHLLGPMAVDASGAGVPGLLLAGDAAGFIDPITGDGLRFALAGATLAAGEALNILAGRVDPATAAERLAEHRQHAFGRKWRFNRSLRALLTSGTAVTASAALARVVPAAFEAIIRYAGDCNCEPLELDAPIAAGS